MSQGSSTAFAAAGLTFLGVCVVAGGAEAIYSHNITAPHDITYRLSGDAENVAVRYHLDERNTSRATGIAAGWETTVEMDGPFTGGLVATADQRHPGTLTCELLVDGELATSDTTRDAGGTVTCTPHEAQKPPAPVPTGLAGIQSW